jgi:Domain of unknown function (DUF4062)
MINPSIFISATSTDLHSARDVVAKVLTSMGYTPVWQDIAATDAGDLTKVLHSWIEPCAAVIQLVGFRYGAEPRRRDPEFGRVSYTQLEALYAERIGKKVIYIFIPENFPTDPCEPEPEEKAELQIAYRQKLRESGVLHHSASSFLELENRVLRIRDDLAMLRAEMEKARRRLWWAAAVVVLLLVGIGLGVWSLFRSSSKQKKALSSLTETGKRQTKSLTGLQQSAAKEEKTSARIEKKVDEIRSLPADIRADRLASALAAANSDELRLLRKAGVSIREVQSALSAKVPNGQETVAQSFFQSSRGVPDAIAWLKDALKDGLDPNMTIPDRYYQHQAILIYALTTGNADAVIALLEAGASPHPYQNLWLTTYSTPRFLFPYSYLMKNEVFDAGEKSKVARAMQKAGAVITRWEPGVARITGPLTEFSGSPAFEEVERTFNQSQKIFGFQLKETPPMGRQSDSVIAKAIGKKGESWEKFLGEMPLRIISTDYRAEPTWIEVRNFIGTYFDRGYFLGTALDQEGQEYALIEISRDHRTWKAYLYIGTRGGMGFAKGENGKQVYGSEEWAWRRFDFTYFPEKNEMLLMNWYKYRTSRDLKEGIHYRPPTPTPTPTQDELLSGEKPWDFNDKDQLALLASKAIKVTAATLDPDLLFKDAKKLGRKTVMTGRITSANSRTEPLVPFGVNRKRLGPFGIKMRDTLAAGFSLPVDRFVDMNGTRNIEIVGILPATSESYAVPFRLTPEQTKALLKRGGADNVFTDFAIENAFLLPGSSGRSTLVLAVRPTAARVCDYKNDSFRGSYVHVLATLDLPNPRGQKYERLLSPTIPQLIAQMAKLSGIRNLQDAMLSVVKSSGIEQDGFKQRDLADKLVKAAAANRTTSGKALWMTGQIDFKDYNFDTQSFDEYRAGALRPLGLSPEDSGLARGIHFHLTLERTPRPATSPSVRTVNPNEGFGVSMETEKLQITMPPEEAKAWLNKNGGKLSYRMRALVKATKADFSYYGPSLTVEPRIVELLSEDAVVTTQDPRSVVYRIDLTKEKAGSEASATEAKPAGR